MACSVIGLGGRRLDGGEFPRPTSERRSLASADRPPFAANLRVAGLALLACRGRGRIDLTRVPPQGGDQRASAGEPERQTFEAQRCREEGKRVGSSARGGRDVSAMVEGVTAVTGPRESSGMRRRERMEPRLNSR